MIESKPTRGTTGRSAVAFLVSQPRSGSTLLQKLLAGHSDIATTSEPWIMLHPSSVFRPGSILTDYDAELAAMGLGTFMQCLPHGRETYLEGMRKMYGHLYEQALQSSGGRIFLDKTPRYYLIIQQLMEVFPQAQVILLLRNPLAVLISICRSWTGIAPGSLHAFSYDLLAAPGLLAKASQAKPDEPLVVHYEHLVEDTEGVLRQICGALQVEFQQGMLNYDAHSRKRWRMGDQGKVYEGGGVDANNADRWQQSLSDPAVWKLCSDYLEHLGEPLYGSLGYSWEEARSLLRDHRPGVLRRSYALSLRQVTGGRAELEPGHKIPVVRKAWNRILRALFPTRAPR